MDVGLRQPLSHPCSVPTSTKPAAPLNSHFHLPLGQGCRDTQPTANPSSFEQGSLPTSSRPQARHRGKVLRGGRLRVW